MSNGQPYVKTRTVEQNDRFLLHEYDTEGNVIASGEMVQVTKLTRTKIEIEREDGSKIVLGY